MLTSDNPTRHPADTIKNPLPHPVPMSPDPPIPDADTVVISIGGSVMIPEQPSADFIRNLASENINVAGYGAAERTCSIIGTAGLTNREITCLYDKNQNLVGKSLPALRIPIRHADSIDDDMPDYMVIFAQSHEPEILGQLTSFRKRGGKCVSLRSGTPIIVDQ